MNEEGQENLPLPPTGDSNDTGITVKAKEQANTAGAIFYDQTWRAIKAANPHLTDQQATDILTLQIQIADWNAQYQNVIKDIAYSNSVEEREQKIVFYATKLDAFRASGIPVDNDLQYLRNVQGDIRQEPDTLNQEWNTSPADVKRTDEAVKLSQEFQEQVERNYNIIMGISPAIADYEPGEIPDDLANQYADEREEGMASAVGEAVKGMWAYLNKPLFDSTTRLTAADLEAGYWEDTMADGLTRVRVRYDEDGKLALHPEDRKRYAETMGNYSKGIIASGLIQGAAPVLLSGAKSMLARLGKVNPQGASKAETVITKDATQLLATQAEHAAAQKAAQEASQVASKSGWVDEAGTVSWPTKSFTNTTPKTIELQPGTLFDRYGNTKGTYASPAGTPYGMRALASGTETKAYNVYEVVKPFKGLGGEIAPWFNQRGGGIQYKFEESIEKLLEKGYIKPYIER
jgi:hypothetical protein